MLLPRVSNTNYNRPVLINQRPPLFRPGDQVYAVSQPAQHETMSPQIQTRDFSTNGVSASSEPVRQLIPASIAESAFFPHMARKLGAVGPSHERRLAYFLGEDATDSPRLEVHAKVAVPSQRSTNASTAFPTDQHPPDLAQANTPFKSQISRHRVQSAKPVLQSSPAEASRAKSSFIKKANLPALPPLPPNISLVPGIRRCNRVTVNPVSSATSCFTSNTPHRQPLKATSPLIQRHQSFTVIKANRIRSSNEQVEYNYDLKSADTSQIRFSVPESDLLAVPKFKVGEYVCNRQGRADNAVRVYEVKEIIRERPARSDQVHCLLEDPLNDSLVVLPEWHLVQASAEQYNEYALGL